MEVVPPLGYTFPSPEGKDRCAWIPQHLFTGCESCFGAELLCAHLSPKPGSRAFPLSELGLGFIPWLPQLEPALLEWKSALVCQPSPELSPAHTARLWLSSVPTGTQICAGSSSWEPAEGRHQEFSSIPSLPVPRGTLTLPGPHPASRWGTEPSPCPSAPPPQPAVHIWDQNLCCAARAPPASPAACTRRAWQCPPGR